MNRRRVMTTAVNVVIGAVLVAAATVLVLLWFGYTAH